MVVNSDADPVVVIMGEEEPIAIPFSSVAAFHGQAALAMLAITFQGVRLALHALLPDRAARRDEISVVSGHPGPGVRDAFEFVTRAVTRGAYCVDVSLPDARFVSARNISYSFRISIADRTARLALRPDVLPPHFFALNFESWRTPEDDAALSRLKRAIATRVLATAPAHLFEMQVGEER